MNDTWRKVAEWIGRTPDTWPPPADVQERVCRRYDDMCQGICHQRLGGKLRAVMDHITPVRDWIGAPPHGNRESNLQPICNLCHKIKTGLEKTARATTVRLRKANLGISSSRNPVPGGKNTKWARRYNRATGRFETVRRDE